jgi:hypothetical protein
MAEPILGEIRLFAGNFAPRGWALCNGQLLSIAQNTALFSLLGTNYGGDGKVTFALPDLQGRVPIGQGGGAGLTPRDVGEAGGESTVSLIATEMPMHNHLANLLVEADGEPTGGRLLGLDGPRRECVCGHAGVQSILARGAAHGREPGAQQHAALPGNDLHHRDGRHLSCAALARCRCS